MRLPLLRALARVLVFVAVAPALGAQLAAQVATELEVEHRHGQTFLTWREAAALGLRYRVYRANTPIASATDLAAADLLGEVDDRSSQNQERSQVERVVRTWVIAEDAPPLAVDQGLFVHTVEADRDAFYAVTVVRRGVENTSLALGRNATELSLEEHPAPPRPVLQTRDLVREVWGHWAGNRDTPFQPALSPTPSRGFVYAFEPGTSSGPRGLLLRLHSAGGNYAVDWPARALVPGDVDVLSLGDLRLTSGWTFWFGAHERFPALPAADTRISAFTQRRLLWTLDGTAARLGAAHDPERVYLAGSSMGATGGMYLVEEAPERFAAVLLRNGNFDLEAQDYVDRSPYELLFGRFELGLALRSGLALLDRTDARFMANRDPAADWPVIRTINGRQDDRVGWASAVRLFAGLTETWRPASHYFDDRAHSPSGYWSPLERTLLRRTCLVRRDRPSLRFSGCTLDDDAGDGTRTSGDTIGTLGGYAEVDPATAAATADALRFDVYLRAQRVLDDAREAAATAVLTPRRTGSFRVAPGELVHFTLNQGSALVAEHWLTADQHGLVHTPPVALTKTRRLARFERQPLPLPMTAGLRLGGSPRAGGGQHALVSGRPGERWLLSATAGNAAGPAPSVRPFLAAAGTLDARGLAEARVELPADAAAGAWLWTRARVGRSSTPWTPAVVEAAREP